VPPGSSVALGLQLESSIPFASLIGPISDMLFDQLIGAGCVERVVAAWVGNVSAGLGHNYRRACEHGIPHPLVVHQHSNFSLALGLLAASLGMPYAPTRTLLGSDLPRTNPDVAVGEWEGEPVVRVRPIRPDVAVLHVQRASAEGFAHAWGNLGVAEAAALAAKAVIVCAEEVVPRAELVADPNRVLVPLNKVVAVVEVPCGAHPPFPATTTATTTPSPRTTRPHARSRASSAGSTSGCCRSGDRLHAQRADDRRDGARDSGR
jgi:glutaconate CoA-transferase, subunit A